VRADGSVIVLGSSTAGGHSPLGNFTPATALAGAMSARVVNGLHATSVSAAQLYALAVGTDGKLYGWGASNGGTLGGSVVNGYVDAPHEVTGISGVTMAAAGEAYAVALRNDGTVWHWPGTVTFAPESVAPRQIAGLADVRKIVRGPGSSTAGTYDNPIAIKTDGTAWAISWASSVQSGPSGPVTTVTGTARQITDLANVSDVTCSEHCLALLGDGSVVAWGNNSVGQLGNGTVGPTTGNPIPAGGSTVTVSPAPVPGLTGVRAIATTIDSSMAVTGDGAVWGWGGRDFNGLGGTADVATPTRLPAPSGAVDVSCAVYSPCVLQLAGGALWGWGGNVNGELGDGSTTARSTPVQAIGIDLD
jgi:alpha-tubulin suppressor-like RCC1 family protein